MGTVQTEGIELRLQDCTSGQEVVPALRTDQNGVVADTTYNYVNTYNIDSRKKYKYKSNQERLLYKVGCIRANDI